MRKLIKGIVQFRKNLRPEYKETFAKLALGQTPDTLFIACSDSRVVPNIFASADPGDLFVIRNVGNLIPTFDSTGHQAATSEAAAIEFSLHNLGVTEFIVCGHSECGAMHAISHGLEHLDSPALRGWLKIAENGLLNNTARLHASPKLSAVNRLSQRNVLLQMEHLLTYPEVKARVEAGTLRVHGWWFDIGEAEVHSYDPESGEFHLIDEAGAEVVLARLAAIGLVD
jgi:carbonic anhydrase